MTDREKAIIMAYTGTCMLTGEKFDIFHKYIEEICGRPIWTHELAIENVVDEIREKSKADFLWLCENSEQEPKTGYWIKKEDDTCWWYVCSECEQEPLKNRWNDDDALSTYCPNCGAKMVEPQESEVSDANSN